MDTSTSITRVEKKLMALKTLDLRLLVNPTFVTLTDAATVAVNHEAGVNAKVTLTSNRVFGNPSNMREGWNWTVKIIQGTGGSKIPTWHANYDFGDFGTPVLSTGAAQADLLSFLCDGTKFMFLGIRLRVD